ncbi:MAG: hypothetical protein U1E56_01300 [Bauldia sp.]
MNAPPRRPLGFFRALFAGFGLLVMLTSGGCTLFLGLTERDGWAIAGPFGVGFFLIGLLIWWLAARVGR